MYNSIFLLFEIISGTKLMSINVEKRRVIGFEIFYTFLYH